VSGGEEAFLFFFHRLGSFRLLMNEYYNYSFILSR